MSMEIFQQPQNSNTVPLQNQQSSPPIGETQRERRDMLHCITLNSGNCNNVFHTFTAIMPVWKQLVTSQPLWLLSRSAKNLVNINQKVHSSRFMQPYHFMPDDYNHPSETLHLKNLVMSIYNPCHLKSRCKEPMPLQMLSQYCSNIQNYKWPKMTRSNSVTTL